MTQDLLETIRSCTLCKNHLPHPPQPVLSFATQAKVLIVGQAPGIHAHTRRRPWDDESGRRLRAWLDLNPELFYDPLQVALVPMGFCYPGKGKSGDLPPRPECAPTWMPLILKQFESLELKLFIGSYAIRYFLPKLKAPLAEIVKKNGFPIRDYFALPHPSPRNNLWLKRNPWFETQVVPSLQQSVKRVLEIALNSPSHKPHNRQPDGL